MNAILEPKDFPIPAEMMADMLAHDSFQAYREDLIARLRAREPGVIPNPHESVRPELYVGSPLQVIHLDEIDNMPPQASVTKSGLETFAKEGVEPRPGAFHGVRLGRHPNIPIAVDKNDDGTYSIVDGTHRAVQAAVSGDKAVIAFVEGGIGPSLEELFNFARAARSRK